MSFSAFLCCLFLFIFNARLAAQWEEVGDSIVPRAYRVYSIKIAEDRSVWLLSTQHNNPPRNIPEVHRSSDEGKSWFTSRPEVDSSVYAWDISPIDSQTAFIALDTAGLYQTLDGGKHWAKVSSYPHAANVVHFFNDKEGIVFAGKNRLFKGQADQVISLTKDGGKSWIFLGGESWKQPPGTSLPEQDTSELYGYRFAINSSYDYSGNTIIIGMSNGNYWISTDKGYHWQRKSTPLSENNIYISNVAMKDSATFMVTGNYNSSSLDGMKGIATKTYTTRDGGTSWLEGSPMITAASSHYIPGSDSVFIISGHNDYHWGGGKGTVISYNYGKSWSFIDNTRLISMDFLYRDYGFATCCNTWAWPTTTGQVYRWTFQLPGKEGDLPVHIFWLLPVALIASGYGWHRYRVQNLKKQNEKRLQLSQLERSALQSQMNPHFLFNALNSLQSYINKNDTERSNEFILHFSQLIRGTLSATDRNEIALDKEISLLTSYLELEKMRFSDRFDYYIYTGQEIDPKKIKIPTMLIQPILENAVLHGLPDPPEKGLIELKYRAKPPFLEMKVTDNGKGIFIKRNEGSDKNKSVGLQNVSQRLKIIHSRNEITIEQLNDAKGNVLGTEVKIMLYLQQDI